MGLLNRPEKREGISHEAETREGWFHSETVPAYTHLHPPVVICN